MFVLGGIALGAALLATGCLQILGLDEYAEGNGGSAGTGSSMSTSDSTNSSGSGMCVANAPCYSGAPGTEGKGNCKAGTQVCDGATLTSCAGEVTPANEDFYVKGDEDCDGHARADLIAVTEHPGKLSGIQSMTVDPDGNLVIGGFFDPSINFGPSPTDALIAGQEQDFFVAKFDATGGFRWSKRFGDATNEIILQAVTTPDKRVWLFGIFKDPITFGATTLHATNNSAFFIAQLDENGVPLQARAIDKRPEGFVGLAALPNGDVAIAGVYDSSIDLGSGAPLTSDALGSFVARIRSSNLATVWAKSLTDFQGSTPGDQVVRALASDAGGNVVAIGSFTGSFYAGNDAAIGDGGTDGFALRLTADGDETALLHIGGAGDVAPEALAVDPLGNIAITGSFVGAARLADSSNIPATLTAAGGAADSDLFVWKVSAGGAHIWSQRLGDASAQVSADPFVLGSALGFAPDGRLVHVGSYNGTMTIAGQTLTSKGADDAMLIVYGSDGVAEWAKSFGDGVPLQLGTAVTVRGTDVLAAFLNSGTMDLGSGPLSAEAPSTSEILLSRFEL